MDEEHDTEPAGTAEQTPDNSGMDSILPPVKPKHILGGVLKVVAIVLVLALIAVGAIWFFTQHKAAAPAVSNKTPATTSSTNSSSPKITSGTTHYDSSNYNLGFDYPSGWTVADEATARLTVTSPAVQLKGADGQEFTGQIVFAVQNQQTTIPAFATNKAVAALESQKIAYKKPTQNQRAQTYITFASYKGDTSIIDALYLAGDNGYQAAQSVPEKDVVQANPLVTISFQKCADAACKTTVTPSTIATSAWSDTSLSTPLTNLLKSLIIN